MHIHLVMLTSLLRAVAHTCVDRVGNQLFDRAYLLLVWKSAAYPQYPYVKHVDKRPMHLFTLCQLTCFGVIYGMMKIDASAQRTGPDPTTSGLLPHSVLRHPSPLLASADRDVSHDSTPVSPQSPSASRL